MRILLLHSDFIKFQAEKQAITAVEKRDEKNQDATIKRYAKEVDDVAKQVKAANIVIYPYVHLTTDPSSPQAALQILKSCEEELNKSYKVTRSPFG